MRAYALAIWLSLIYVSASLVYGDVLKHVLIATSIGDQRYIDSHIEWAMGIFVSVIYVLTRPLFYYWRNLSKKKVIPFIAASLAWPLYLVIVGSLLFMLPIRWQSLLLLWQHSGLWLWMAAASDPFNILGKWIDQSDSWQRHIDKWRSYGTLSWYYSTYPPRVPGDVAVGLVFTAGITVIAPLVYLMGI